MSTQKLVPVLGLLFLTLGFPAGFVSYWLMPGSGAIWDYRTLLMSVIFPGLGGFLTGWRWGLIALLFAPLYVTSCYVVIQGYISILIAQNPTGTIEAGGALLFFLFGLIGTGFAIVTTVLATVIRLIYARWQIRKTPSGSR